MCLKFVQLGFDDGDTINTFVTPLKFGYVIDRFYR